MNPPFPALPVRGSADEAHPHGEGAYFSDPFKSSAEPAWKPPETTLNPGAPRHSRVGTSSSSPHWLLPPRQPQRRKNRFVCVPVSPGRAPPPQPQPGSSQQLTAVFVYVFTMTKVVGLPSYQRHLYF